MKKNIEGAQGPEDKEIGGETEVDIYLMRHSNRFAGKGEWTDPASGEIVEFNDTEDLTPEGKARAREFGFDIKEGHSNVVSIGSTEARAAETGADIEEGAQEPVLFTDKDGNRVVNQARGITYKELGPDTKGVLFRELKPIINEVAGKHPQYGRLSAEERALVRQGAQAIGMSEAMKNPAIIDEAAEGMAYNLYALREISKGINPGSNPALPLVNHGLYNESLLKRALVVKNEDGNSQIGFEDVDEIGGFFNPAEAFKIKIIRDGDGEERYECEFTDPERQKLFAGKKLSIDWSIVEELFHKYDRRLAEQEGRQPYWDEE